MINDENDEQIRSLLAPLRVESSEVFVQNVMRKVRAYGQRDEWVLWPRFVRWALPALALSVSSFAAAMIYTIGPAPTSPESLLLEDQTQNTSTSWISSPPNEDQILDSVVAKP
jgi:hypothetical protein